MRSSALAFSLLLALGVASGPAEGKVFESRKEAVASAFPDADRVAEQSFVLDDEQVRAVESLAHARLDSKLVTLYTGLKGEQVLGYALIEVHTVRTLPEAFLVVISPEGEIRSLRMLAFYEPPEYLPTARWLEQFHDEKLSPELLLQRKIHGIAGATLSARAVTGGVRRALALYEVLVKGARSPGA